MSVPIISVTGTKGKTTTVAVIADVLQKLNHNVLKVDTTGHFVNGERLSTLDDSKKIWRLVPSVCPGRYLWEFRTNPALQKNGVAVLECSLGCSAYSGMGYRYHNVGIFLNVFEDHIGSSNRINSKDDIVTAKQFIFERLPVYKDGSSYAVFNADDQYVVKALKVLDDKAGVKTIACGLNLDAIDAVKRLSSGNFIFTVNDNKEVIVRTAQTDTVLFNLKKLPWTFNGTFLPSVYNLLHAAAGVFAFYKGDLPNNFKSVFESIRLDNYGGRLTLLENKSGVTILADYAHEKQSLIEVAKLARTLLKKDGKVIGVVRLAHDRADKLMKDTGESIAAEYSSLIVYEKIDGYWRKPVNLNSNKFPQVIGRTSKIFAAAIASKNPRVERILREDQAIARAAEIAKPGDTVVVIVNDDIKRSIDFIKKSFKADFV